MKFDVFSLFPEVFSPYLSASIMKRAIASSLIEINIHNIRDWAEDRHHTTDDTPYGGGGGMVMKPEPIFSAVESILDQANSIPIILMTPQGRPFKQEIAKELSTFPHVCLICGHYEGIDERVREHLITDEISIGDYVLTGGELPALVVMDAVSRYIPGVLGDPKGAEDDSHASGLLEHPQYTRPPEFRGWTVPEILLSGNHAEIDRWRLEKSIERTKAKRPDIYEDYIKSKNRSNA